MMRLSLYMGLSLLLAACGSDNNDRPVSPVNAAPTLSAIADQSLEANSATDSITFSVTDDITDADALVLTVASDNPDLVPVDAVALGGSGTDRTLIVTPLSDRVGEAIITLRVEDAAAQFAEQSFLVTVVPALTSVDSFVRGVFALDANDEPLEINALEFVQDAGGFDDLLSL